MSSLYQQTLYFLWLCWVVKDCSRSCLKDWYSQKSPLIVMLVCNICACSSKRMAASVKRSKLNRFQPTIQKYKVVTFCFYIFICIANNVLCYASGFYTLLFLHQLFMMHTCVCVCVRVVIVHWHCSAQPSMFNMEKRYRNKSLLLY